MFCADESVGSKEATFREAKHCHAPTRRGPMTEETAVPAAPSIDVVAAW